MIEEQVLLGREKLGNEKNEISASLSPRDTLALDAQEDWVEMAML